MFWDRFLKDEANEVDEWPSVEYDVRKTLADMRRVADTQFPPANVEITAFPITSSLSIEPKGTKPSTASYVSYQAHRSGSAVSLDYVIPSTTEITGYASAKLYVQALKFPDADLFLALQKIDSSGKEVKFIHSTQKIEASAAFGWLRTSHRELDPELSTPERPYHKHQKRQWLRPRDIVEVNVELWPSSTVFEAGETLRLTIQGQPFTDPENPTQAKGPSHGWGEVRVWFGGEYDSGLLLPVVASK
jgi:uncharacterized protein